MFAVADGTSYVLLKELRGDTFCTVMYVILISYVVSYVIKICINLFEKVRDILNFMIHKAFYDILMIYVEDVIL